MATPDDNAAEISVGDARLLAQMLREWRQFKATQGGTGVGANDGRIELPAARGWVRPADHYAISGKTNVWRYNVEVFPHPFALLLDPHAASLAPNAVGYNLLETANTADSVWNLSIVEEDSESCGEIYEVLPVDTNYSEIIVEASLYWTYFESGDPTDGYWAWWFSLPNMVNVTAGS